ncbi:MAG: hypothetical protein Q9221_005785 [Calogaya cf. arnoldii]
MKDLSDDDREYWAKDSKTLPIPALLKLIPQLKPTITMRFFTFLVAAFAALATAASKAKGTNNAAAHPGAEPILITDTVYLRNEPDKVHRSTELVTDYIQKVKDNEPDTLEYGVLIAEAEAKFIIYAAFKDRAAFDYNLNTSYLAEVQAVFDREDLERAEDKIDFLTPVDGFTRECSCGD